MTEFAPAERVPIEVVHRQRASLGRSPLDPKLLSSLLNFVFVLNAQRQIVFASDNVGELTHGKAVDVILGMRLGEALACTHAHDHPGGCGTSKACRECGMTDAILASLDGEIVSRQSRVTRVLNVGSESLDFLVYTVPFEHKGERYSVFSIQPRAA